MNEQSNLNEQPNLNEQSNRVYGNPDKYINTQSKPELSEEEQRRENARARVALRQQKLEEKAEEYIDLINQNHGISGKHAGAPKPIEIDQTKEDEYRQERRYAARKNLEQRMKENKIAQRHVRNLKIKEHAPQILAAALVISATMAGVVGAIVNGQTIELQDQPAMEQPQESVVNDQTLKQAYQEAGIVPTEEELAAGLTAEQIQDKRALDESSTYGRSR